MYLRIAKMNFLSQGFQMLAYYRQNDTQTHVTKNIAMRHSQMVKILHSVLCTVRVYDTDLSRYCC